MTNDKRGRRGAAIFLGVVLAIVSGGSFGATFNSQAYFWSNNADPPRGGVTPPANYSYCRNLDAVGCSIRVLGRNDGLISGAYVYRLWGPGLTPAFHGLTFATPYGVDNKAWCGSETNTHPEVSNQTLCAWGTRTQLSVRVLYQQLDGSTASGHAAYGWVRPTGAGVGNGPWISHSYNSTGATNTVTRRDTGLYTVSLPGLGTIEARQRGAFQVVPVFNGTNGGVCMIERWTSLNAAALNLDVRCYGANGELANQGFMFVYEVPTGDVEAYIYSDKLQPTSTDTWPYSSNSGNRVIYNGTGRYTVFLPATDFVDTNVQLTAVGTSRRHCTVAGWHTTELGGTAVNVNCWRMAANGVDNSTRVDSKFFLSYYDSN